MAYLHLLQISIVLLFLLNSSPSDTVPLKHESSCNAGDDISSLEQTILDVLGPQDGQALTDQIHESPHLFMKDKRPLVKRLAKTLVDRKLCDMDLTDLYLENQQLSLKISELESKVEKQSQQSQDLKDELKKLATEVKEELQQQRNCTVSRQLVFSWAGGVNCVRNNRIGTVDVTSYIVIEFDFVVKGMTQGEWKSILHIGREDGERSPSFWISPKALTLHARMSNSTDPNQGYDSSEQLHLNTNYHVRLECFDGVVTLFLNGIMRASRSESHWTEWTRTNVPIWVSNPWYKAANVAVSNLNIYGPPLIVC